ncbi:MAG: hypothetical protein IT322_06475 [Anaerolineae bacterium]|nr:hypothetical protein [Anaerolineae bacterium]
MQPSLEAEQIQAQAQPELQVDLVSLYRIVLRVLACLEESDYTEENLRQVEVLEHSDLPDPASGCGTSQG